MNSTVQLIDVHSKSQIRKSVWLGAFFCLIVLSLSPVLAFLLSVIGLLCVGVFRFDGRASYFIIFSICAFWSIVIAATSHPIFLFEESDFTIYYFNYYQFYTSGFDRRFFFFAGGFEVGLPILHYIFSILIDAPMPHMVKLWHALCQTVLLYFCVFKIGRFHNLNYKKLALLLAITLIFFKYGSTLNHLRQGYSSLFIILGVFSLRYRWVYFLIAVSFHVSAIVIFPLISFLILSNDKRKLWYFCFFCALFGFFSFVALRPISDVVINSDSKLLGKLVWAFSKYLESENMIASIKGTLFSSIYFFPLIAISIYARIFFHINLVYNGNLAAMTSLLISFCYLPAFSVRILSSVLLILMGYLYFYHLFLSAKLKQFIFITVAFLIFFTINWIFFSPLYYYNYPMFGSKPFYYIDIYFEEKEAIRRYSLPSQSDITIQSPYKL